MYVVVDRNTNQIVKDGFRTRQDAKHKAGHLGDQFVVKLRADVIRASIRYYIPTI